MAQDFLQEGFYNYLCLSWNLREHMFSFEVGGMSVLGMSPTEIGICVSGAAKARWITDCSPAERKWDPTGRWSWSLRRLPNAATLPLSGKFVAMTSYPLFKVHSAFELTSLECDAECKLSFCAAV